MPSPRRSRVACRRTRCSRTICSRDSTRARRWSPTSRSWTTIRRASSPTRGASTAGCVATGRSCGGCFPFVPVARRAARATGCRSSPAGRFSTTCGAACVPPATLLLLVLGWTVLPGHPLVVDRGGARGAGVADASSAPLDVLRGPRRGQSWGVFLRTAVEDLKTAAARGGLQLAFMANEACERLHAIGDHARPPGRHPPAPAGMGDDGGERRARRPGAVARVSSRHDGEPAAGAGDAAWSSRSCGRRALPVAPPDARAVGRRAVDRVRAQPADAPATRRADARGPGVSPARVARKTWAYFDAFVGAEDQVCRRTTSRSARS